jgi:hypothetical protein
VKREERRGEREELLVARGEPPLAQAGTKNGTANRASKDKALAETQRRREGIAREPLTNAQSTKHGAKGEGLTVES